MSIIMSQNARFIFEKALTRVAIVLLPFALIVYINPFPYKFPLIPTSNFKVEVIFDLYEKPLTSKIIPSVPSICLFKVCPLEPIILGKLVFTTPFTVPEILNSIG